jgi:hypothetical protein
VLIKTIIKTINEASHGNVQEMLLSDMGGLCKPLESMMARYPRIKFKMKKWFALFFKWTNMG